MEDKELIANATQLLSELNKSFQRCKQGTADDIRLQELLNTTVQENKKSGKIEQQYLNRPLEILPTYQSSDWIR